jgi:lipoprotein-anchoring transpeptidase ErfK/SrfK
MSGPPAGSGAPSALRYRLGFLGAWALFVIAVGIAVLALAAEAANLRDERVLARVTRIDRAIGVRLTRKSRSLRQTAGERRREVERLRTQVGRARTEIEEQPESAQTIVVSTAENRLWVRRGGKTVYTAVCSTGKGTTLVENGRRMVFDTPTGRFRVVSKEENPVWVPPDWHYSEEARKKKLSVVRLGAGEAIDADTGEPVPRDAGSGVWAWLRGRERRRVLKVRGDTVIEVSPDGAQRELPPGELIRAGKTVVIPPLNVKQRRFDKVLGRYRLNIGDGYALHGTLATNQLGRSVSHGCVRLGDTDIEKLYEMSSVGDEVIIY